MSHLSGGPDVNITPDRYIGGGGGAGISAETILENRVSCIMIHEISCITYSKNESIHGVYRFFSTQPITKKAKMNRFTVLESQNRLSTKRKSHVGASNEPDTTTSLRLRSSEGI